MLNVPRLKISIIVCLFTLVCLGAEAQSFRNANAWRSVRHELTFGFGVSNTMSDLGGRDMIGSDFLWDLEFSRTRPGFHLSYGYYMAQQWVIRTRIMGGRLMGDDKLTQEPFRMNRNLHFRNDLLELTTNIEWHFLQEKGGNRYGLRNKRGIRGKKIGAKFGGVDGYMFTGVGAFYHQPKALYANQWVKLKPLSTEGQGLPGGPKPYSNVVMCIPVGFGFRKSIDQQWSIGIEFAYRFTFTDYLDDVSNVYYDKSILAQEIGPESVYLSDPNLGLDPNPGFNVTGTGQQRGDVTDKDGYMFLMLNVHYKIKSQNRGYGSMRRKRYKASF